MNGIRETFKYMYYLFTCDLDDEYEVLDTSGFDIVRELVIITMVIVFLVLVFKG